MILTHRITRLVAGAAMFLALACSASPFHPDLETPLLKTVTHEWQDFGGSVAVDGFYAAVGASQELLDVADPASPVMGAVHIYRRDPDGWRWVQRLTPPNGAEESAYGYSISLSEGTLAVGAYRDNTVGFQGGAVHVYVLEENSFTFLETLLPSSLTTGQIFGLPVAVSGSRMVVGANGEQDWTSDWVYCFGSAYVFERGSDGHWMEQARLTSPAFDSSESFAWWVDIDGGTVVVGAPYSSLIEPYGGTAYVFEDNEGTWSHTATLLSENTAYYSVFGLSVAVRADTVAVGSPFGGSLGGGSVDVFRKIGGVWTQEAYLEADDSRGNENLGLALALSGDTLVAGAPGDWQVGDVELVGGGSVYVFERGQSGWSLGLELAPGFRTTGAQAGFSVALDGRSLMVGAPGQLPLDCPDGCQPEGSADVFEQNLPPVADASATGPRFTIVEGTDVEVLLDATASSDPDGDDLAFEWWLGETRLGEGMQLPVRLEVGLHALTLRVSDGREVVSAPWTVEVVRPNRPPVAQVAVDHLKLQADVSGGALVQLDGSGSTDPDRDELRYSWALGDEVVAEVKVADVWLSVGLHVVVLTVSDGEFEATASMEVEIEAASAQNNSPVADASRSTTRVIAVDGKMAQVRLDGTLSTDPDGDALTYRWWAGDTLLGELAVLEIELPVGVHGLQLLVSDGAATAAVQVVVRVLAPSRALKSLLIKVGAAGLKPGQKIFGYAVLRAAGKSFDRGKTWLGIRQLRLFQRLMQHRRVNSEVAAPLIAEAEAIIQAMEE